MPSNFYDYYEAGEQLDESLVYLAAHSLIENNFQVIPLKKGTKEPSNIKHVYEIISHPINIENINFYFKEREVDLGIIMDHSMEFIDIDSKNKPGVERQILKAIQSGWPELFEKLVIDYTPSGGCHIIYRSEITGGATILSRVYASPNPLAIVERISRQKKQYIKISPSEGYTLKQGNPINLPFLSAEERNYLSAIATSFNEVHKPEVKKKEAEREDSPWSTFNKTHNWEYIKNELLERNWTVYQDRPEKVLIKRPGNSEQRYSGIIYKDTSVMYLFTSSSEFENERAYTAFGVYCFFEHDNNIAAASKKLASEGCGVNIFDEGQFWIREKNKIKIKYGELLGWLHLIGYRKYKNEIVQIIDNVVSIVDEQAMKKAFLNEVEFEVKDDMYEKVATIFTEKGGLMSMLQELPDNFIKDDREFTWLFYKNISVKISAENIDIYETKKLSGYIWQSEIILREYYAKDFRNCDAERFIRILGCEKTDSLCKIIGYTISKYKDPLNPRAVILMEDIDAENEGESQGGSGKGLCFQFIKQFRKTTEFDGKNFRFSDPFLYQNVEPDTHIIFIDDVEKNFRFNSLFSVLTNSLLINKKNKPQIIIPFEQSPKIFITSNYSIGDTDASSKRRKYEFPVVKYFGQEIEPVDVFGRHFFTGWDYHEWLKFDNFIIYCCQLYLKENDKKSIGTTTLSSAERALIANTNREFIEYMDAQLQSNLFDFAPIKLKNKSVTLSDGRLQTNAVDIDLYNSNPDNPDNYFTITKEDFTDKITKLSRYKNLTPTRVTQWLNRWADARNVKIDSGYKRSSDGERMYKFVKWDSDFSKNKKSENSDLEVGIDDTPF